MTLYDKMSVQLEQDYTCLIQYKLDNKKDVFLGSFAKPRRCRFCGKTEPDTTFKKVAHAIPHFIGNRTLKSLYECDSCNEKVFSPMESHFSHFMGLYHVLSHVSKGGKVPTYKINAQDKAKIVVGDEWTDIYCFEDENLSYAIDKDNRNFIIKGKRSYIPIDVFKLFVKMALSIMPNGEMSNLQMTLAWLMIGKFSLPNLFLIVRIYESLLPFNGQCMIYKRKPNHVNNVPCYLFGLSYNNIFIQTYLPLSDNDKALNGSVNMPFIPCESDRDGFRYLCFDCDLSSTEKVFSEDVSLSFTINS